MRVVLHHCDRGASTGGELDGDDRAGRGQVRRDEAQTDRAPERRRHAGGGDAPDDLVPPLHKLASFLWHDGAVDRLQADKVEVVAARLLPDELWFAHELVLVELDQAAEAGAEPLRQPIGVLGDDQVPFFQSHDALRLNPKGADAKIGPDLEERLPEGESVCRRHVNLVT